MGWLLRGLEKRGGVSDLQSAMPLFVVSPTICLGIAVGSTMKGGGSGGCRSRDERPFYTPDRCTAALCPFVSFSLLLGLVRGTGRSTGGSDPMCVEAPWGIVGGVP